MAGSGEAWTQTLPSVVRLQCPETTWADCLDPAYPVSPCGQQQISDYLQQPDPGWVCAQCQSPSHASQCEAFLNTACGIVEAERNGRHQSWVCAPDVSHANPVRVYLPDSLTQGTGQPWTDRSAIPIPEDPGQRVSNGVEGMPPMSVVGGRIETCEEFAYQATYTLTRWVERLVKQQTSPIDGWHQAKADFLHPGAQQISIFDIDGRPLPHPGPADWGQWFDFTSLIFAWDRPNGQVNYGFGLGRSVVARDMDWHLRAEQQLLQAGFTLQMLEDIRDKTKEFESLLGELGYTHRHMFEAVQRGAGLDDGVPPEAVLERLLRDLGPELGIWLIVAEGLAAEFNAGGLVSAKNGRWTLSQSGLLGDPGAPEGFAYDGDHSLLEFFSYPSRNLSPLLKFRGDVAPSLQGDPPFESIFADPTLSAFTHNVAARVDERMVAALANTLRGSTTASEIYNTLDARRAEVVRRLNELYDELQPVCNPSNPACVWAPSYFIEAVQRYQNLVYQSELRRCRGHTGGPVVLDNQELFQVAFTIPEIPDSHRPRGPLPPGVSHPNRSTWEDPSDLNRPWNDEFTFDYTENLASMRRFFAMKRFYEALRSQFLRARQGARDAALLVRERLNIDPATGRATFASADSASVNEGNRAVVAKFERDRFHDERLPRSSGTFVANDADACMPVCASRLEGAENTRLRASVGTDLSLIATRTDRSTGLGNSLGIALPETGVNVEAFGNVVTLTGGVALELYEDGRKTMTTMAGVATGNDVWKLRANLEAGTLYDAQGNPWLVRNKRSYGVGLRVAVGVGNTYMVGVVPVVLQLGVSASADFDARNRWETGVGCVCDPDVAASSSATSMHFVLNGHIYGAIGIGINWASVGVKGQLNLITFAWDREQQKIKGTGSPCHDAALAAAAMCDSSPCQGGVCAPGVCQPGGVPPPPGCSALVCASDGDTVGYSVGDVFLDANGNPVSCDRCYTGQDIPTLGEADIWVEGTVGTVLGGRISLYAEILFARWERDIARFAPKLLGSRSLSPHQTERSRMTALEIQTGDRWATLSGRWVCDDVLFGHVLDLCGGGE